MKKLPTIGLYSLLFLGASFVAAPKPPNLILFLVGDLVYQSLHKFVRHCERRSTNYPTRIPVLALVQERA
ncbi:MAG: hypothetical protein EXS37_11075 [Opitutus sp.]|nr:hypothetical protein [Opitutus sp.]